MYPLLLSQLIMHVSERKLLIKTRCKEKMKLHNILYDINVHFPFESGMSWKQIFLFSHPFSPWYSLTEIHYTVDYWETVLGQPVRLSFVRVVVSAALTVLSSLVLKLLRACCLQDLCVFHYYDYAYFIMCIFCFHWINLR